MDKLLYISMTGARESSYAQANTAHNIANASTTAFKADLAQFRSMPVVGEGHQSRVFAMNERPGHSLEQGGFKTTGYALDISIADKGWLVTTASDGSERLTRRGDLKVDIDGALTNGAGHPIMGDGGPIFIPPYQKIEIGKDGTITILPKGAQPKETAIVDRLKLVNPDPTGLVKDTRGLFKSTQVDFFENDLSVSLRSGGLEASNVSVVEELTNMINLSRKYEAQVKLMSTVEERGQAVDRLLQP